MTRPDIAPAAETITLEAFAARLGRTRQFVAEGIRAGQLPGVKVGREYVIPALAVERFMRGDWRPADLKVRPRRLTASDFERRRKTA